jgi:hypothetical protein
MVTLIVNGEGKFDLWWSSLFVLRGSPAYQEFESIIESLVQYEEVSCSRDCATRFVAWASHLPGWGDGPGYAATAIKVR